MSALFASADSAGTGSLNRTQLRKVLEEADLDLTGAQVRTAAATQPSLLPPTTGPRHVAIVTIRGRPRGANRQTGPQVHLLRVLQVRCGCLRLVYLPLRGRYGERPLGPRL